MSDDATPAPRVDNEPKFLRVDEVAKRYGIKPRFVYQLANERRIPKYKVGKVLLFDPRELDEFFASQRVEAI